MATTTTLNSLTLNYLTQAQFDALSTKEANQLYLTPDSSITEVSAGSGLSGGGSSGSVTLNHSNSVTAKTTQGLYPITFDAQGHITGSGSAVTITDENMKWTASTSTNTYYPLQSTSTATTGQASTLNSISFYQYYNTAGGYRRLILGNSTSYTSSGGAYGTIRLYGTSATYYGDLNPGTIGNNSLTANRTWTLPNATGTIALTSDIPSIPTSTESSTTGITASTTANKTTLGTASSIYGVQSTTTTASKVAISGSNSFNATVTSHVLSFSHSAQSVSASDVTVPIKNTSSTSVPNVSVASATVTITDPGHTHTI